MFLFIIVILFHLFYLLCLSLFLFSFLLSSLNWTQLIPITLATNIYIFSTNGNGLYAPKKINLFKGLLYNVFSTPKSYPNIDTLDDLYESELEIHVRHAGLVTDIFGDDKDESTVGNLRRRLTISSDDFLNHRIASSGGIAALERYANYEFENNKLVPREDGISNLHLVAQCPRWESLYIFYSLAYLNIPLIIKFTHWKSFSSLCTENEYNLGCPNHSSVCLSNAIFFLTNFMVTPLTHL